MSGCPKVRNGIFLSLLILFSFLANATCFSRRIAASSSKRGVDGFELDSKPLHAIVTTARGEADFIVEWINYHTWLGYRRFYIYNQDDDPAILEGLLTPYISAGLVVLKHWHIVGDQRGSYIDFLHNFAHAVSTFTFLDVDEFLRLCKHATIDSFIAEEMDLTSPQAEERKPSCLELPWYMFGTSDLPFHPPRTPVLTQYFHRAKCSYRAHAGKVIVQVGTGFRNGTKADLNVYTNTMHHSCREHSTEYAAVQPDVASIYHYSLRHGDHAFSKRTERGSHGDFSGQKMYESLSSQDSSITERNEHRDSSMLRILETIPDLMLARPLKEVREREDILACPDFSQKDLDCKR